MGSVRLALFEVFSHSAHGIGDVREAENPSARAFSEGVEGGSLHFHREYAFGLRRLDRLGGFAKWSIRRPTGADDRVQAFCLQRRERRCHQARVRLAIVRRRRIVIARSFVAQRAIDDDEVWGIAGRSDLPGGGDAQQQSAATCEQLFRDQNGKRRADRAADDPDGLLRERERVERGVVAGPALETPRLAGSPEVANDVSVRVQNADERHIDGGETLLPPRFAQQRGRPEYRRRRRVLVIENRSHGRAEAKARTPQHSDTAALLSNVLGSDRLLRRTGAGGAGGDAPTTRQPPGLATMRVEFLIRRSLVRILHERRELVEVL